MNLETIRAKIDEFDGMIISLLARRSEMVTAAGQLKKDRAGVRDPQRVEQVIEKVKGKAVQAGLDPDIAEKIYRTLIGCFVQRELEEFSERENRNCVAEIGTTTIRKASDRDAVQVVSIFNHYVEHSFAAYPDRSLDVGFFDFMKTIVYGDAFLVLEDKDREVIGFGFLKKYHPYPAFNGTAEVGYFILPEYTRKGLGTMLLTKLEDAAHGLGVGNLLANISSLNPASLAFHQKQGFRECGRFRKMLKKFGQDVDIIWMQKML